MPLTAGRSNNPLARLTHLWRQAEPALRGRLLLVIGVVATANILIWATILAFGVRYPILLGLAPIAFGFGLRHAVDPDHIAAIDNTTRKLMRDGQRPVGVGFFFSLGHSSIVFALSILIAVSANFVRTNLPQLQSLGAVIGTSISSLFLVAVAVMNLVVFVEIFQRWQAVRAGEGLPPSQPDDYLTQGGVLISLFRPVLRIVSRSWQMYFVGLLFGLGFDTASEVGILGMSATAGAGGMPVWLILLLPLLFVAGMSLIDTADGVAMLGAYGWAHVRPIRKLYYNMNITLMSVVIALFIGGVEILQVLSMEAGKRSTPLVWAKRLPLNNLGPFILAIMILSWLISVTVFKLRGIDRLDDALAFPAAGVVEAGE